MEICKPNSEMSMEEVVPSRRGKDLHRPVGGQGHAPEAVPAEPGRRIRSLWIIFTTRKYAALRTPGSELKKYDRMHPIHFGLILVYNLCIGNITPPVGNALFVGIKVGRTTLAKAMPYMLMYYAAIILGLLLVTYIPAVSMVLPQVTGLV